MKYLNFEPQFFYSISHGWIPNFAVLPIIDYKQWKPTGKNIFFSICPLCFLPYFCNVEICRSNRPGAVFLKRGITQRNIYAECDRNFAIFNQLRHILSTLLLTFPFPGFKNWGAGLSFLKAGNRTHKKSFARICVLLLITPFLWFKNNTHPNGAPHSWKHL